MLKKNQKGQALIELIIFLPVIMMMYSIIAGFANAINGSINQQKITRSYLYYRIQNNSNIPKPDTNLPRFRSFGFYMVGWREKFDSNSQPVEPCYRLTIPLSPNSDDSCDKSYSNDSTFFIRVGTAYGLCGATFGKVGNQVAHLPDTVGGSYQQLVDLNSCTIQQ